MEIKLQSAIEFLTVYSFVFVILSIVIVVAAFLATSTRPTLSSQCSSYGVITCNYVNYYTNATRGYSLITFSITNGQSSTLNISNANVTIRGMTFNGICSPPFLYPGQEATCIINTTSAPYTGSLQQGYYTIKGEICNSSISNLINNTCSSSSVSYGGVFSAYALPSRTVVFSVVALVSNMSTDNISIPTQPVIPPGYNIIQNGELVAGGNNSDAVYTYGTSGFVGEQIKSYTVTPFPQTLSTLSNNNVACVYPYNSTFSIAYSALYFPYSHVVDVSADASNSIDVYYMKSTTNTWTRIFGTAMWPDTGVVPVTNYPSLDPGLYYIAVVWSDTCGPGLQAVSIGGKLS